MKNNNNPTKFNLGDWVYIIDYDCDEPVDISGYILLMANDKFALLSPAVNDTEDPDEICDSYYRDYQEYQSDCECVIVPISELFTKEEAEAKFAASEPCDYDCDDENEDENWD